MTDILTLATAGLKSDQIQDTNHMYYPRVDYVELQRRLKTHFLNYNVYNQTQAGNFLRYLETQMHSDLYLTLLGLRQKSAYRLVFAMSERAGIPFALLNRPRPQRQKFVTMFQCWSAMQERVITTLGLFQAMDGIAVHCQSMKQHLVSLGAPPAHTHVLPYSIDHRFYSPLVKVTQEKNLVVSIGETRSRDYAALFQAVADLPVNVQVAAAGMWYAREKVTGLQAQTPDNVTSIRHMLPFQLREWYARAQFVVLPIRDLVYSAGATGYLEAASMGRAVIAFRSRGIVDFIIDGETGILVPPGDVQGMREAIAYLLANPQEARRLGQNARQRVEEELNLDAYVQRLICFLQAYLPLD
ncbi:MAG: glycosyltransferase family 4 protein [Anaerolinea sp.]|nr:glycosyltransferase family 4 protein [Anaerolinea sp.]